MINTKGISDVFEVEDITYQPIQVAQPAALAVTEEDKQLDADIEYVRNNTYNYIEAGKMALNSALELARQSEQPRAFEVFATLLKAVSDVNTDLINVHEKKAKLKAPKEGTATTNNTQVNNSVFVGSTAELSKMLKGV